MKNDVTLHLIHFLFNLIGRMQITQDSFFQLLNVFSTYNLSARVYIHAHMHTYVHLCIILENLAFSHILSICCSVVCYRSHAICIHSGSSAVFFLIAASICSKATHVDREALSIPFASACYMNINKSTKI